MTAVDEVAALPPELLERFRAIGLRLDRDGQFWHQGERVAHPRLRQALLRWLDVRDDGRDLVRLDEQRYAYVDVDDAHLRVTAARWRDDRLWLWLDDGAEEELAYPTLTVGATCWAAEPKRARSRPQRTRQPSPPSAPTVRVG